MLFISRISFAQTDESDTTIFLSITLIEQQTISKDIYGSVATGEYFASLFIVNKSGDTITVENRFPYLVLKKKDLLKLDSNLCFSTSTNLFVAYKNNSIKCLIKIPLTLCGKKNWLLISHPKLKSKFFDCFFSFQYLEWNTGGLKTVKGIDVLSK